MVLMAQLIKPRVNLFHLTMKFFLFHLNHSFQELIKESFSVIKFDRNADSESFGVLSDDSHSDHTPNEDNLTNSKQLRVGHSLGILLNYFE